MRCSKYSKRKSPASGPGLLSRLAGKASPGVLRDTLNLMLKNREEAKRYSTNSSEANQLAGRSHERDLARRCHMEETRGSGCGKVEKGDVKDGVWNGQAKSTKAASFPLSLK